MAAVEWQLAATVAAPPAAVFAWLSDYREDDHARPAFFRGAGTAPGKQRRSRRTVRRTSETTLEVEDAWGRKKFRCTVTLDPARLELRIDGDFGYRATWTARPEGEGTRVEVRGVVAPGRIAGVFLGAAKKSFLREMEADFRGHMEDLRESIASQ